MESSAAKEHKKTRDSSPAAPLSTTDARNGPGTVVQPSAISDESKAQDFSPIKSAISHARFESHRDVHDEADEVIFKRYQWNAEISECFYAPLTVLEVVLRNRMNEAIAATYANPDWLLTYPKWMHDDEKADVQSASVYLAERHDVTQDRMVQEMSFGFWTSLFNSRYEPLFHAMSHRVFPGMQRAMRTRKNVSRRFEQIRKLRNRLFHFRRIWNRPNLLEDYDLIVEAIDWMNPKIRPILLRENCRERLISMLKSEP